MQIGSIPVPAFTGAAQLPVKDVAVTVSDDGDLLGYRLTDSSGKITPIRMEVPDKSESLQPDVGERPYRTVTLNAVHPDYERITVDGVQVFSGITTDQNLQLIPLAELPDQWAKTEEFQTNTQNL